jgi:DNA-directed RNA polymerase specialized sigma24 family protein
MSPSTSNLTSPSTSSATEDTTRPSGASTTSQLLFLAIGLVSFAVLWAVPVVLLTWVLGTFFGSVGIAELLERTRGLAPTTYGGAFWLAVTVTTVMAVLEVRAMLRKASERRSFFLRIITRPSTAYWVLFLPTLLLVRIDVRGTDVPDILTTTLLLCCLGYVWFILPLALGAVSWRITRWMWRKGAGSSFAAGVLGMLGLAFASCTPLVCVVDDDDEDERMEPAERVGDAFDRGFDRARGKGAIDGSRALMGALAEVIENEPKELPPAPEVGKDDRKGFPFLGASTATQQTDAELFDACIEELFRGGTTSIRGAFLASLVSRHSLERALAEDIVQDAALELCLRHARVGSEPYEKLAIIFGQKVESRLKNRYRYQDVRNRCEVTVAGLYYEPRPLPVDELAAYDQALCSLDPKDQKILLLDVEGHEAASIGVAVGLTADAVRQRKSRGIKKLRGLLQNH